MLNSRDEQILKTIHHYRYMTAIDMAYRLFSPSSKTHVREILSGLSGNADHKQNEYLYRFGIPKAVKGNIEHIYTLGARGRNALAELGLDSDWYHRPSKVSNQSYSHIVHSLMITKFLVAANVWFRNHPTLSLIDEKTSYTMQGKVVPDGLLLLQRQDGAKGAVLVEIDRGNEQQERFKKHIRDRLVFVRSGRHEEAYGTRGVFFAYVVVDDNERFRQTRLRTMQAWAMEVLKEEQRENWASMFRFSEVGLGNVYKTPLFDGAVWLRPDKESKIPLFGG